MLSNLFGFTQKESSNLLNNDISKQTNKISYVLTLFVYFIFAFFTNIFKNSFINMYNIHLQTNRLTFDKITNLLKHYLLFTMPVKTVDVFFRRIKNINHLYSLREKKNPFLHRFWCLHTTKNANYLDELVTNVKNNKTISNKYFLIKPNGSKTFNVKTIMIYYLNKIVLTNNLYFYWTDTAFLKKFNEILKHNLKSQNKKWVLFCFYLNSINSFFLENVKNSFIKVSTHNFKGVKYTIKNLDEFSTFKSNVGKKNKENLLLNSISKSKIININDYFNYYSNSQINYKYKTIVNNIVNNFNNIKKNTNNYKNLSINWYNKIHNSVYNIEKNNIVLYIRTARHFNKGRYSRNRQLYRTGVYWCIWLNVVIVYALHYYFYRVIFSFGYLWLPLSLMILVMFSSRLYKYRFYSLTQLIIEFKEFNKLVYYCNINIFNIIKNTHSKLLIYTINFKKNILLIIFKKI